MVKQREAEVMGVGLNHRESRQHGSRTASNNTASSFVSIRPLVGTVGAKKKRVIWQKVDPGSTFTAAQPIVWQHAYTLWPIKYAQAHSPGRM